MEQRDTTFDVMKGIGILAMIIGHCSIPTSFKHLIFAWHMPLFFLISGYFYKEKPKFEYIKKNARQLIIPYILTSVVMILLSAAKGYFTGKDSASTIIIAAMLGNGSPNSPTFSSYSIGAIWFLLAMFYCRIIYNLIDARTELARGGVILTISVVATYIGSMIYLPTDILEGGEATLFFFIGHMARKYRLLEKRINKYFVISTILLFSLSIYSGSLSMVRCYYGYWPVNVLAACGMVVLIYHLSRLFKDNKFLSWCGRVSILILCIHNVELTFLPLKTLYMKLDISSIFDIVIHPALSIIITYIALKSCIVRNLFCLKS